MRTRRNALQRECYLSDATHAIRYITIRAKFPEQSHNLRPPLILYKYVFLHCRIHLYVNYTLRVNVANTDINYYLILNLILHITTSYCSLTSRVSTSYLQVILGKFMIDPLGIVLKFKVHYKTRYHLFVKLHQLH